MTISPEAKEAGFRELDCDVPTGTHVQLAINSATAPLQKEIERLKGEVEKAYWEGFNADGDARLPYNYSRARRVAEGKK